jgi:hypothetical protein
MLYFRNTDNNTVLCIKMKKQKFLLAVTMAFQRGITLRSIILEVFPFPFCKAQIIGENENRRGAPKCSVRLFFKISMIPPHCLFRIITFSNGAGGPWCANAPIYWRRGASARQYIGAPMSPAPMGNAHQAQCANNFFFVLGPPLLLAQGASVRQ